MGRHRQFARWASLAAGLAFATAALGADAWSTYRNAEYGFSIEIPSPPKVTANVTQTPAGPAPGVVGQMETAAGGGVFFASADYSKLGLGSDLQARLEAAVAGAISNSQQTLDSETRIDVDGVPGRDITAHSATIVSRARVLMKHDRIYMAVGVGLTANGVPAEYPRLALSLKPD